MDDTLTEYVAKNTMELKDVNMCLSFISTIWRDKLILIVYDNLNKNIITSWFNPGYQVGDLELLEKLVGDFLT